MNQTRSRAAVVALFLAWGCGVAPPQADAPASPSRVASRSAPRAGQVQHLRAPGAALTVQVPIVDIQGRDFATWWRPQIHGSDGQVLYSDPEGFPARFNIYWAWDDQRRLWVYNTDDGGVWVYAEGDGGWARGAWDRAEGLSPPADLTVHMGGR